MIDLTDLLLDELCDDCNHKIRQHADKYGCQHERGDRYTAGYAPIAIGPCGCVVWTVERIERMKKLIAKDLESFAKSEPGLEANPEVL